MRLSIVSGVVVIALIAGAVFVVTRLPFVPYNIRELVVTEYPFFSSLLIACFATWTFGFPVLLSMWFAKIRKKKILFLVAAILHGLVAWGLLLLAVPMESIYDITGSTVFHWPWELERMGRFLALFFIATFTMSFSAMLCLVVLFKGEISVLLKFMVYGLLVSFISHYIVFEKASTDNLTELVVAGGTLVSSLLLILFLVILSLASSQFSLFVSMVKLGLWKTAFLFFLISFPAAFMCIYYATEDAILKYGQKFSALQFLLSTDRQHLASTPELLFRYVIVHTSIIILIALVQVPFWLWIHHKGTLPTQIEGNVA